MEAMADRLILVFTHKIDHNIFKQLKKLKSETVKGGESKMNDFEPTAKLIPLNKLYGKGCDVVNPNINGDQWNLLFDGFNENATTGYLKIEKI